MDKPTFKKIYSAKFTQLDNMHSPTVRRSSPNQLRRGRAEQLY